MPGPIDAYSMQPLYLRSRETPERARMVVRARGSGYLLEIMSCRHATEVALVNSQQSIVA